MRLAVDCSNYTGVIETPALEAIKAFRQGRTAVHHAICGTQVPSVCDQQLTTFWNAGFSVDSYVQPGRDSDLRGLALKAKWACEAFPSFFMPTGRSRAWFALEVNPLTDALAWLESGIRALKAVGFLRIGIYTRQGAWDNIIGPDGDSLGRKYPIWYANYDDFAPLTSRIWRLEGFGGWWKPSWKQYAQNIDFGGQPFDLNQTP